MGGGSKRLKTTNLTNTSHKLPKIAFSLALIFGSANLAFAEESGGFVGFGIGGGETQLHQKGFDETEGNFNIKQKFGGINYGFVGGYKQFFTPYLGLRYYVNLNMHHNLKKTDQVETTYSNINGGWEITNKENLGKKRLDITLINYGVNVDFLGNFVVTESMDFGGFVGVGIGATSLVGKFVKEIKDAHKAGGVKFSDTGFDIALNLGLRTNIATHHGIELVARVPFLPVKMCDYSYDNENGITEKFKATLGQTFSIMARYTFSF